MRLTAALLAFGLAARLAAAALLRRAFRRRAAFTVLRCHNLYSLVRSRLRARRSARRLGDRVATLHADPFLRAVFVQSHPRPGRLAALRIDQHHVGDVNRRLHFDDAALLFGLPRLAVSLHDVHALHRDAPLLRVDANHFAALALVVATYDQHLVAANDGQLHPRPIVGVALSIDRAWAVGFTILQNSHIKSPRAPATRSSCTSGRAARAPRGRRCASRAAPLAHW